MNDLDDFLGGRLSVYCESNTEVLVIYDILRTHGINGFAPDRLCGASIRVDVKNRPRLVAYTLIDPEWHVRSGYTKRWMRFPDFIASCEFLMPRPDITTLDGLV